jgi:hypothetical protein
MSRPQLTGYIVGVERRASKLRQLRALNCKTQVVVAVVAE